MTAPTEAPAARRSAKEHVAAARAAERAGLQADAERAYADALDEDASSSSAALGLVRLLDKRGDRARAEEVLRSFVAAAGTSASIEAAARQWVVWQSSPRPGVPTVRVAITGSGTLDPLCSHLRVACAHAGIHPMVYLGGFEQWAQDLLSPNSALYGFAPDIIILLLDATALFPKTTRFAVADGDVLASERIEGVARLGALLDAAAKQAPGALLVVHSFSPPDRSPFGILDLQQERGQRARFDALNDAVVDLVKGRPNVLLLDHERLEARHGKSRVRDERLWYLGALPFSESFLPVLAAEHIRIIRPLKGLVRKCIVLDLDETLWGGIVGEDGIEGLKLGGNDAPGNAYRDFQEALANLRRRGVLLALCSRNNPDDVWPVIEGHPHMVLRRSHFAAARVNWGDKASNIREIAAELNLGIDSLVFFDDNPMERARVRQQLPEVLTVDLPTDPAYYVRTLLDLDVFESLAVTAEDAQRSEMYAQAQARRKYETAQSSPADLTSHLHSLEIAVTVGRATPGSIARIAQLVNKTNQFNLTTRRYTEAQVRAMADAPERWRIWSVSVSDRFGDFGLTGVAIVQAAGAVWSIDSFLLSCRVLGRGVEDALLAHIAAQAKAAGARALQGTCIPTAKNAPARNFYPEHGFRTLEELDGTAAGTVFELELDSGEPLLTAPRWVRMTEMNDEH
jgi:FkbH-like protein